MKLSIVGHFGHRDEADAHPAKLPVAAVDEFGKLRHVGAALGRLFDFVAGAVVDCDLLVLAGDEPAAVLLDCAAGRDEAAKLVLHALDHRLYLPRLHAITLLGLDLALQGLLKGGDVRRADGRGNAGDRKRGEETFALMLEHVRPARSDAFLDEALVADELAANLRCYRAGDDLADIVVLFKLNDVLVLGQDNGN